MTDRLSYRLLLNARSSWISTYTDVVALTEQACRDGIASLKDRYPPIKWGTREETQPRKSPTGEWIATVWRSAT